MPLEKTVNKGFTLDTSVIVSAFYEDDVFHAASKNCVNRIINGGNFVVPILVLIETFQVLRRKGFFENKQNFELFLAFLNFCNPAITDLNSDFLWSFMQLENLGGLKTADATISAVAKLNETTLVTWDKVILKEIPWAKNPQDL